MHLHLKNHITINAPAKKVWRVLAHEFDTIGQWASAIPTSQPVPDVPVPAGAQVGGRVCATAVPGFAAVQETFTSYDEPSMHFSYQATEGRPWFLKLAENHWAVRSLGPQTSLVEARAELDVRLFPGLFLAPLLNLQMSRVGAQSLEELKYYVEHDESHPRKLKARQKQVQKDAPIAGGH
jgi:polyketide cyclase/dehydrase/lipid transport protein